MRALIRLALNLVTCFQRSGSVTLGPPVAVNGCLRCQNTVATALSRAHKTPLVPQQYTIMYTSACMLMQPLAERCGRR